MILTEKDTDNEGGNSKYSLINEGTIEFNGNDSVGINVYAPNLKHEILEDEIPYNATIDILNAKGATITVNGSRSYGMRLSSYINKIERFENKGTINVGDDKRKLVFQLELEFKKQYL